MSGAISDQTTGFSNVSLTGTLRSSRVSSTATIQGNAIWGSTASFGATPVIAGVVTPSFATTEMLVPAHTVQGSASSFTVGVWSAVLPGDIVLPSIGSGNAGVSSLSSGLVMHSHVTIGGQFEFRYSNVSTLAQAQSAQSIVFLRIRPF